MSGRLKDLISPVLDQALLSTVVGSYDVVGDIAIILVPPEMTAHQQRLAEAILAANRRIRVVAKRDGRHGGEYRIIPLEILAGERRLETEVVEFGVRLNLDLGQVYYSVRSGSERRRIAALIKPGEHVLVFFSGVAPFPLMLARHSGAAAIVGIEKNPRAHRYAIENLGRNRRSQIIELHCGDVHELAPRLNRRFHRLLMPLPTMAAEFLPEALVVLKPGGILHFYDLCRQGEFAQAVASIDGACRKAGRRLSDARIVRCGHCGPRTYRICVDAVID